MLWRVCRERCHARLLVIYVDWSGYRVFSNLKSGLDGIHYGVSAKHLQPISTNSRSASIARMTRSTPYDHRLESL